MSKELLQQALDALRIADDFCKSFTADDCPDTVANPIRDAFKLLESVAAIVQPDLQALIDDLRLNHEFCPKEIILQAANALEVALAQPVHSALVNAAQAVLDRWDSPQWTWAEHGPTANLMRDLRRAIAAPVAQAEPMHAVKNWMPCPKCGSFERCFCPRNMQGGAAIKPPIGSQE